MSREFCFRTKINGKCEALLVSAWFPPELFDQAFQGNTCETCKNPCLQGSPQILEMIRHGANVTLLPTGSFVVKPLTVTKDDLDDWMTVQTIAELVAEGGHGLETAIEVLRRRVSAAKEKESALLREAHMGRTAAQDSCNTLEVRILKLGSAARVLCDVIEAMPEKRHGRLSRDLLQAHKTVCALLDTASAVPSPDKEEEP